ncbi:hypothetical protein BDM02DRAFT_3182774 [Thelephora ganbajun]|uniref:Uncharacterized protein n=1 Tax=Thelephora ganbajun TaxID=370292 RepID=A0ACB6ZUV1_THEGA|nr:hypothetical protein BDM02DRAFT_3182774 [Thelephora ganbajun]
MSSSLEGAVSTSFEDDVLTSLWENINSLAPPQDATLPSRQNGVCIPQKKYEKGAGRGAPNNQNLVLFVRQDGSYLPVIAALDENYDGLVNRDLQALGEAGFTIIIRFEWPGYVSQDFQVRTFDWCVPPKRISLSKLGTEVAKVVRQLVDKLQTQNIAPEHAQWRVGPNGIEIKDLRLAALEQVSAGSYQARLFYKPQN